MFQVSEYAMLKGIFAFLNVYSVALYLYEFVHVTETVEIHIS